MKIIIIGTGNVATHIATALNKTNNNIIQIISKKISNAKILAKKINCDFSNNLDELLEADLYIISVPDKTITEIANHPKLQNKFIVHTSGSVKMNILSKNTSKYGVFYPLQTFNKNIDVDFSTIPLCLESSSLELYNKLNNLASQISSKIYKIDSIQRKKIHIAAVFVNNFINHLFTLAEQIIEKENIDFEILKPLISKTFENIQKSNPKKIQTGPAKRKDFETIEKHLEILKEYPQNFTEIYKSISESIISIYFD